MRVLHVAGQLRSSPGILRQMEWEQEAADALGLDWQSLLIRPCGVSDSSSLVLRELDIGRSSHGLATWVSFRRAFYAELRRLNPAPDVLLLRRSFYDPLEPRFIRSQRNVLIVHHAIEDAEITALGGLAMPVKRMFERSLGPRSIANATGLIGLTDEILEHEQSRHRATGRHRLHSVYPNGRLMSADAPVDERDEIPTLAFVASEFSPWQGLEDLLNALEGQGSRVRVDVIGGLSPSQRDRCERVDGVVVHGMLGGDDLDRVMRRAWVGLAPLRADSQGLTQTCSLKVRDYLAAGVPVVSGQADVLPDGFPFFRLVGTDIEGILAAAHEWRSVDRVTVREAARPHIDKVELVRRLHEELVAAFASADG
jgi:glycosyltransferase involved in cell wall biosynthesis